MPRNSWDEVRLGSPAAVSLFTNARFEHVMVVNDGFA